MIKMVRTQESPRWGHLEKDTVYDHIYSDDENVIVNRKLAVRPTAVEVKAFEESKKLEAPTHSVGGVDRSKEAFVKGGKHDV